MSWAGSVAIQFMLTSFSYYQGPRTRSTRARRLVARIRILRQARSRVELVQGEPSHRATVGQLVPDSTCTHQAIYTYAKAVMLYEQDIEPKEVASSMEEVPRLLQRIAGKSIPLEKFVSRRARKFTSQQNRLLLAGLDLTYVLNCFGLCPGFVLHDVHLKQVDETITELDLVTDPTSYGQCTGEYWDGEFVSSAVTSRSRC